MLRHSRPLLAVLVLACAGWPVAAGSATHERSGWTAGIGFGIESVSWRDEDGDRRAKGSGVGNARVGYAIEPDLVLGVEFWAWAKDEEIGASPAPVPTEVKLTATMLRLTYFPASGGFFARFGAGLAHGRARVDPPSSVTSIPASVRREMGLAVDVAPGYEWRLSRRFALGAQGDVIYLGLGNALENAFGYGLSAQFNWYW